MKKGLLLVVCLLMGVSTVWAQQFSVVNVDGKTIYYNITDSVNQEVEVYQSPSDNEYSGEIDIPSSVEYNEVTYSVVSIGNNAFSSCEGLTSVTMPNSITTIEKSAFMHCDGLTSVTIPNSVTTIGDNAFKYCDGFTSVTIPNSVTTIGKSAFGGCKFIIVEATTPPTLGKKSFGFDSKIPIYVPNNSMSAYQNNATWNYYTNLRSIDLLFEVANSEGEMISYYVIDEVNHYVEVTIGLYSGNINIPSTVNYNGVTYSVTTIGGDAFKECVGVSSVMIPNSVTIIGESAFEKCVGVTSVVIPNTVVTIGNRAFGSCEGLTSVMIGNSVTSLGEYAFAWCSALNSVTIGNSVTTIGYGAFSFCDALTVIIIPNSVTAIGECAFEGCSNIDTMYVMSIIPPTLGDDVFMEVPSTIPVYVPCAALDAYLNDAKWSYFTNIQCDGSEGIEDKEVLKGVSVYPNPTNGVITIEAEGVERVVVMSMVGEKVAEFKGESMIDLSELGSGVYVLRITTKEGTTVHRVMKK